MAGDLIYAFRVMRLPLLDAGGAPIGRIEDIVVIPGPPTQAPRVLGFVASSQRRRIFVNAGVSGGITFYGTSKIVEMGLLNRLPTAKEIVQVLHGIRSYYGSR